MWAQRSWVGRYLPRTTVPGTELGPYSRLLNAVEGNTTFYASPPALTVRKWRALAHPGFRFVFKAPREVTHDRRLRDVDGVIAAFVDLLAPLDDLLGGITLQLPPSFGPSDLDSLDAVLRQAPSTVRWSVEVRHPEFFGGDGRRRLETLLAANRAERVLLDTSWLFHRTPRTEAGHEEWRTKPRVPVLTDALTDRPVVRFIGSDHPEFTDTGLRTWHDVVAGWLREGRTPTFFVHTPDNARTPHLARTFHDVVRAMVPGTPELPEPPMTPPDEQMALF
jgi:uncharacterized protein YecE (DUF72 family)